MMLVNEFVDLALPVRLSLLALFGAVLGGFLNWAIYRWAWRPRAISPWGAAPKKAPPRAWSDRLPIVGWFGLQRESKQHGAGFWVRPLLIEAALAIGLPWLYWWEVVEQGLVPSLLAGVVVPVWVLHLQFCSHVVLIALMTAASFIDIDDRVIPDQVTVSGVLLGLLFASLAPWSLLPEFQLHSAAPPAELAQRLDLPPMLQQAIPAPDALYLQFMTLTAPAPWQEAFGPWRPSAQLVLGLGCFWFWIFAALPRPWYPRHGLKRAFAVATRRMSKSFFDPLTLLIVLGGSAGVAVVWQRGGAGWVGLLTALVGLVGAGAIVWAVRIIGAVTLRKEAMGFGDVLLMMMIGTFLGWQACLIVFFIAPFAGLIVGLLQLIIRRDQSIPYGPFLCLAALAVLLGWAAVWEWAGAIFSIGWFVPAILMVCLAVMAVMLLMLRLVREAVFGREERR